MLSQVDITNNRTGTLSLPLSDISSGYLVKEIDGLDPVDASLTSTVMAQVDGAQPQNASRSTRNITMKLGFEPDYVNTTVQLLRKALYGYLMPKDMVQLSFYDDGVLYAYTTGQVESFQAPFFASDPEVDISIICYDPDFYSADDTSLSGNTYNNTATPTSIGTADGTFESGVTTWSATGAVLTQGNTAHTGSHGGDLTAPASPGSQVYFRPNSSNKVPVFAGSQYTATLWARQATVSGTVSAAIDWQDASGAYLSTSASVGAALVANTWTMLTITANAPVNGALAVYGPTWGSPGANRVTSFDDILFQDYEVDVESVDINYGGTSDAGIIFTLSVNRIFSSFTIYNTAPDNTVQAFLVTGSFAPGDVVTVDSRPLSRGITLNRAGLVTNILYSVDPSSSWIMLQGGDNNFRVLAAGATIPYTIEYTEKYGGL